MEWNLADLFESVADAVPDRVALVCGEQRLRFAELEARANRCAHALAARGVGPGAHVGLYLHNGTEYVESMLACLKLRAVPVNVNFRYVEDELRYLLQDSGAVALVHQRGLGPRVASVADGLPALRARLSVEDGSGATSGDATDYAAALAAASPEREFPPRSGDDLYVIYTGGTTGMPKGVMWRQEDLFFSGLFGANPGGPPAERPEQVAERAREKAPMAMMSAAPLIHGAAQLGSWIALLQGYVAVLAPRFDPREIWRTVEAERVRSLSIVGDAMARPLAEALEEPDFACDASSLLVLSSAGAILSPAVREQLKRRLPKLGLLDSFGASETGAQGMEAGARTPDGGMRFRMNENTVVLDDDLHPIEPGSGQVGRLALRGRVPLGYHRDAEKTARTFVSVDGVRHVLPGDLARPEADGTITVFGRGSQCINSGGEKIFPEEVEGVLKSHPDVFDAVVVGVPDARWGERVAALVQLRPGRQPEADDLAGHCRKHLAGYKVPRQVRFVEHMERSPSGKPDYPWAKTTAQREE